MRYALTYNTDDGDGGDANTIIINTAKPIGEMLGNGSEYWRLIARIIGDYEDIKPPNDYELINNYRPFWRNVDDVDYELNDDYDIIE